VRLPAGGARDSGDAGAASVVRAGLRLDMQNSSQERRRNSAPEGWRNSAPPSPKRGERSKPVRLGLRDHQTHLFARTVQRKLSNGVAGFAAGRSSSDRKRSRPVRACCTMSCRTSRMYSAAKRVIHEAHDEQAASTVVGRGPAHIAFCGYSGPLALFPIKVAW
jgi:hypothetical protein